MTRRRPFSRPRRIACPDCGDRMFLVDCGVEAHRTTRTRSEQIAGRCPGRVYAHVDIEVMDKCPGLGLI